MGRVLTVLAAGIVMACIVVVGGDVVWIELARADHEPSTATMAFVVTGLDRTNGTAPPVLALGE